MSACRRCSECVDQDHHWSSEIRTDDAERLQCKHCDATAAECETCDGEGSGDFNDESWICGTCVGTGIVDVRL